MPDNEIPEVEIPEVVSEVTPLKVTHILPKLKKYFGVEKGSRISDVIPTSNSEEPSAELPGEQVAPSITN